MAAVVFAIRAMTHLLSVRSAGRRWLGDGWRRPFFWPGRLPLCFHPGRWESAPDRGCVRRHRSRPCDPARVASPREVGSTVASKPACEQRPEADAVGVIARALSPRHARGEVDRLPDPTRHPAQKRQAEARLRAQPETASILRPRTTRRRAATGTCAHRCRKAGNHASPWRAPAWPHRSRRSLPGTSRRADVLPPRPRIKGPTPGYCAAGAAPREMPKRKRREENLPQPSIEPRLNRSATPNEAFV